MDHESCFNVSGPRICVPCVEIPQGNLFPANSISIGSRPTNGVSRCLGLGFMFPASRYWFPADQWGFEPQEKVFPANSISIGSRPTNGVSRCLGLGFMFPASRYPRKRCFRQTRFPLVPGRPMGFRGVWASDSCSPHRDTPTSIVTGHTKYPCR